MFNVGKSEPGVVGDLLRAAAVRFPTQPALKTAAGALSYQDLWRAVTSTAAGLVEAGVKCGDRIAILLPNSEEAVVSIFATFLAGAIAVPLHHGIKALKAQSILRHCTPKLVICSIEQYRALSGIITHATGFIVVGEGDDSSIPFSTLAQNRGKLIANPIETDIAAIIYTSGSTGQPKGVTLTHRNIVFSSYSIAKYLDLASSDRILSVLPLAFDYGLYQTLLAMRVGATLFLESGVDFPARLLDVLESQKITCLPGVPSLFRLIVSIPQASKRDWSRLRLLTNTGDALSTDTIGRLHEIFTCAKIFAMYGLTECKRVSYLPPAEIDKRPTSVGIAIPGTTAWVEDDSGRRLPAGEVGQLVVRGPHIMSGYWNDPETTALRIRDEGNGQRTLLTGDQFTTDNDGFLYFVSRSDDIIKTRGERVSPREVEEVLLAFPTIFEAGVIGLPHHLLGQEIVAYVCAIDGASINLRELDEFCRDRLDAYAVPSRVLTRPTLPKSLNGKVDRRALRQDAQVLDGSSQL